MKGKHRFKPGVVDALEERLTLNGAKTTLYASPILEGLRPRSRELSRATTTLTAQVNQAFDSFQADYAQARGTYFASLQADPASAETAHTAFLAYTSQRTSLLSQQLAGGFIQTPTGGSGRSGPSASLRALLSSKIGSNQSGSLLKSLTDTTPTAIASAPTITLYTLGQDNAIASARTAILNSVSVVRAGGLGARAH
ncbi:hypothetical protein [Paludisphaera mucosa]|uniref:Flagellar hook-associated protein 2 C-terminal domain-containing protein n=1 Tax=Paludisphaera mucosa TaxID=3030827 RepID=A0ABT6F4A3_9BACT|nr:hypothetical protein [Paludisphaera mucosa]MDG3002415.1 hypothetical protein [Paludisphaera mucosa]